MQQKGHPPVATGGRNGAIFTVAPSCLVLPTAASAPVMPVSQPTGTNCLHSSLVLLLCTAAFSITSAMSMTAVADLFCDLPAPE